MDHPAQPRAPEAPARPWITSLERDEPTRRTAELLKHAEGTAQQPATAAQP